MIFDRDGNTTIILQEKASLATFLKNLQQAYPKLKNDHLILNLFSFGNLTTSDLLEFMEISNTHRGSGKSFVLVSSAIAPDDIPEEISMAPTLQEARDIIEMEEIERDLDL
ncbi:ribonuclease Z [Robiginitalea sp.]|uniref:ribonuclease Z n=1 Tax=Robiginitalea sp. TaxID=1902411 RepID=UPI003C71B9A6